MKMAMPRPSQIYKGLKLLSPLSRSTEPDRARLMSMQPTSAFSESFRLLALNMRVALADRPTRGVVVMSAYPEDGRSTVSANLAIALAEESNVLLVASDTAETSELQRLLVAKRPDAATTRPSSIPPTTHLTEHGGIWLLNGSTPAITATSNALRSIVMEASQDEVFTVVDSPPALTSSKAFLLAREVGQVIYVIRNRGQDMGIHRGIREQLQRFGVDILGLVTNEI